MPIGSQPDRKSDVKKMLAQGRASALPETQKKFENADIVTVVPIRKVCGWLQRYTKKPIKIETNRFRCASQVLFETD